MVKMELPVAEETDKVLQSISNVFVEGITTEKFERAQLVNVQQELEKNLEQRRALLIQYQEPSLMKEAEEEQPQLLDTVLKGGQDAREDTARQRNVAQLRNQQLTAALKVAQDMKSLAENYRNTYLEYSNSNIARHLPELVERAGRLAGERERALDKYERLRHSYLHLETTPGDAYQALALLNKPMMRRGREEQVHAARLELQRLWYFAPPSSRCPRLLHDVPPRSAI